MVQLLLRLQFCENAIGNAVEKREIRRGILESCCFSVCLSVPAQSLWKRGRGKRTATPPETAQPRKRSEGQHLSWETIVQKQQPSVTPRPQAEPIARAGLSSSSWRGRQGCLDRRESFLSISSMAHPELSRVALGCGIRQARQDQCQTPHGMRNEGKKSV